MSSNEIAIGKHWVEKLLFSLARGVHLSVGGFVVGEGSACVGQSGRQRAPCRRVAAVALACLVPLTTVAQGSRQRVEYDVEFSTLGSLLDANCSASGTDVLAGKLVGFEPPLPNQPNEYVGTLVRSTRISICGTRRNTAGEDVVCGINIAGNGFPDVVLTIEPGQREGYLQYISNRAQWARLLPPRPVGPVNSSVTGTCDPAEMAQLQNEYPLGQTAGSPSGQPIEVPSLPPPRYPFTFQDNHPRSIWSLKVLARRP